MSRFGAMFGDDWEERNKALSLLARRLNPDYEFLNEIHWTKVYNNTEFICLICKNIICLTKLGRIRLVKMNYDEDNKSTSEIIDEHGLIHLKEYNLLALI